MYAGIFAMITYCLRKTTLKKAGPRKAKAHLNVRAFNKTYREVMMDYISAVDFTNYDSIRYPYNSTKLLTF